MTTTIRIGNVFETGLFVATAVLCASPFLMLIANSIATLAA